MAVYGKCVLGLSAGAGNVAGGKRLLFLCEV
jgi:hypothetical protein